MTVEETAATAKRAARVTLATCIAGVIANLTGNDGWFLLTPVISGLGKFLRAVFNLKFIPF